MGLQSGLQNKLWHNFESISSTNHLIHGNGSLDLYTDYFKEAKFFLSNKDNPAFMQKREEFVKLELCHTVSSLQKAGIGMGYHGL